MPCLARGEAQEQRRYINTQQWGRLRPQALAFLVFRAREDNEVAGHFELIQVWP